MSAPIWSLVFAVLTMATAIAAASGADCPDLPHAPTKSQTLAALAADAPPPNVVLILSDDQAWTDYGCLGSRTVSTPNIDRLAAEGAAFIHGYVPTSLCRPSLATLITGQYPHTHGITGNDPPRGTDRRDMLTFIRQAPKLPALLAQAGYVSFQAGKWWEGNFSEGGFTAGMTHGDPTRRGRHGDVGLKIGRQGLEPIWQFLDAKPAETPFFLWYAPMLPHDPHNPPARLLDKYQRPDRSIEVARYLACCEWFDETVGELLDGLDQRGLTQNTLVVYVCDNGWVARAGDASVPAGWTFPFNHRSKRSPFDDGVRTPILLRWPGHIAPLRLEVPVSSVDLAPTILHAVGLPVPSSMSGQNLLEVVADESAAQPAVFGEIYEHDLASLDDPTAGLLFRWCRQGDWKLIVAAGDGGAQLYDLRHDPHEMHDLAGLQPQRVEALRATLDAWWTP